MPRGRTGFAIVTACAAIAVAAAQAAAAADVKAGRQKALQCQTCHGLDGQAKLPDGPNLAGQNEIYLAKALKDYRSGARDFPTMRAIAANLTDAEIDGVAKYYSGEATPAPAASAPAPAPAAAPAPAPAAAPAAAAKKK